MHPRLLKILRVPSSLEPLHLESRRIDAEGRVLEGTLVSKRGDAFAIRDAIPRFLAVDDRGQDQVKESFGFKWATWGEKESDAERAWYSNWISRKYGFSDPDAMADWMRGREFILDAGCGSGETAGTWLLARGTWANYVGLDISSAVDVARSRYAAARDASFVQGDALNPPFEPGAFDTVISEGVLHHTPSTRAALLALAKLLRPDGVFLFYVYAKKGPIREYADDHIRTALAGLSDEEFLAAMRPLTRLAQALDETGASVDVPEEIPYLGIKPGRIPVQRLIYYSFLKAFWNPAYSFDKNNLVNFDWYRPTYAHRQTPEEVRSWCEEAGLAVEYEHVEPSGITIRARKA